MRPVITATCRIHSRRAAKLGQVADQRLIEQTPLIEIFQQRAVSLVIEGRHDIFHALDRGKRFRAVDIPGNFVEHGQECVDGDKSHTGFNQSPGQQTALAKACHPVTLTDFLGFLGKIKSVSRLAAGHQAKRCLEVLVQQLGILRGLEILDRLVNHVPHPTPTIESGGANIIRRQQVRHLEFRLGRIRHQGKGIVRLTQETTCLSVG